MKSEILKGWKQWARKLKLETRAVYLACRHEKTPWYARLLAACVVGYDFSPIDLIPDFIPVLGYLDDLLIVPLGIALVIKIIPVRGSRRVPKQVAGIGTAAETDQLGCRRNHFSHLADYNGIRRLLARQDDNLTLGIKLSGARRTGDVETVYFSMAKRSVCYQTTVSASKQTQLSNQHADNRI